MAGKYLTIFVRLSTWRIAKYQGKKNNDTQEEDKGDFVENWILIFKRSSRLRFRISYRNVLSTNVRDS